MSILNVIERARREPPFAPPGSPFPDLRYVCKVLAPVPWSRDDVERELGIEIPNDLAELWNLCGGLILYEDNTFRQWGLVVRAPPHPDVFTLNRNYREHYADNVRPLDLIFARFLGDRERALIRSDKTATDHGTIMIVAEMDPRREWSTAAHSLEEFLVRFMDANGEKPWELHYREELPEGPSTNVHPVRRMKWNGVARQKFIAEWHALGYPGAPNNWDGEGTEIHHIKPRQLGGTNDFWNLVPLRPEEHEAFTDYWRNY